MRGVWSCIVALAACDNATSIEVVVPPGMAAEDVDLFIPLDGCRIDSSDCTGLTGDNNVTVSGPEDRILALDTMLFQAADGAGTYEFRLEPGERDRIELLIAVARSNGAPTGAVVFQGFDLNDGPARRRAELGAVPDFRLNGSGVPDGVHVWDAPPDLRDSHCVEVTKADVGVIAIVDSEDPDCDGFTDRDTDGEGVECEPLVWNGGFVSDPNAPATCSLFDADSQRCFFGSDGCQDGVGRMGECSSKHVCTSADICSSCATNTQACYFDARQDTERNIAHLDCTIGAQPDGQGNLIGCNTISADSFVPVTLGTLFGSSLCEVIQFAPLGMPESIDTSIYLKDKLELPSIDGANIFTLTAKKESDPPLCNLSLGWVAPAPEMPFDTEIPSTMLIDVKDKNGLFAHQMLLPVHVTFRLCDGNPDAGGCILDGAPGSLTSIGLCAP